MLKSDVRKTETYRYLSPIRIISTTSMHFLPYSAPENECRFTPATDACSELSVRPGEVRALCTREGDSANTPKVLPRHKTSRVCKNSRIS
jgi:hypothetical protein